jgi:hypothetical protein
MVVKSTLFSAVFLLTNSVTALYKDDWIYMLLFILLFGTSISVRLVESDAIVAIDNICIFLIILYGGWLFIIKQPAMSWVLQLLIMATFLATIYLYIYGYYTSSYSYDSDEETSQLYHSLLHAISSVGHHIIVLS